MAFTGAVTELWRYPVKSMAGERVDALRVDWRGAGGDRTHALHFEHKGAPTRLTVRQVPRMVLWRASYPEAEVETENPPPARLTAPDGRAFSWSDPALGAVLAADLGRPVTLRRDLEGQQDLGRSLLLTTEASLRALERELGTAIDPRRFRTNLHVELDAPAWAEEDGWEGGTVELSGGTRLRLLHPCERCVIPTRDPDTGERWPELLKHLHRAHATLFGINARVEAGGRIAAGERISVGPPGA